MASSHRIPATTIVLIAMVTIATAGTPVFYKAMYTSEMMEEDANVPVYVTTVSAYDPDGDTDIWYSLQDTADHYFSIDPRTGAIEAIKPLDREQMPRYHLVATATNQGGSGDTGFTDVVVELHDINDNAPFFPYQPYIGMVSENSAAGTTVMRVMAEDPDDVNVDQNAHIEYSIDQNARWNITHDIFAIDPTTGDVTILVDELDREAAPMYEIMVKAMNGDDHIGITPVTVIVTDENDSPPEFSYSWYTTIVKENTAIGTTIYRVTATDGDASFSLTFSIIDGNDNDTFTIQTSSTSNEGMVMLDKDINYENPWQPQMYNLTLQVSDGMHTSDAMLWIMIEDVNENAPVFDPSGTYQVSCLENVTIGTELAILTAMDDDGDELSYMIAPVTDPLGQFHIDVHNGTLTTAGMLDRETMEQHNLTIVAYDAGEPLLSTSTEFVVTLEDVNDNGPMLAEDYRPVVPENVAAPVHVIVVSAMDADSGDNGEPYSYSVDNSDNISNYFLLEQFGNEANITTNVEFDREEQGLYLMPIIISDVHGVSATSTLTIEIGDENDNPHSAGVKEISAFQYNGRGSRVIGHVFAPDPDTIADKYYDIVEGSEYFQSVVPLLKWNNGVKIDKEVEKINSSTGEITILDRTPEGTYDLQVSVQVNSSSGDITIMEDTPEGKYELEVSVQVRDPLAPLTQISEVIVDVSYIFDNDIANSASLRLAVITPEDFIVIPPSMVHSKMQNFTQSLANIMSISADQIVVFNVAAADTSMPMMTDVHYHVRGYRSELLDATVATNRAQIEREAGIIIAMVNINECVDEHICDHGSCSSVFQINLDMDSLVDAGSASLSLSVMPFTTAECTCLATTCPPISCEPDPCLNGGMCMATNYSFQCQCPPGFSGPQCQDISRSFSGNGYAWYMALESCYSSTTSLEFLTVSPDGVLLYNGPLSLHLPNEPMDYIALVLKDGMVHLEIDLGSGMLDLSIPGSPRLDDGRWHNVEVYRNGWEVNLMVDHCVTSVIEEYPTYSNEDTSSCLASGTLSGHNQILNLNTPLQVGGVAQESGFRYPTNISLTTGFDGCIRNIMQDTSLYDLGVPAHELNTARGCSATDAACTIAGETEPEPFCMHGTCIADITSTYCVCDAGYHGYRCEEETQAYDFGADSYVSYSLNDSLKLEARVSDYQIMFRTRESSGVIWQISATETREGMEFIHIRLIDGHVHVIYDLGEGERVLVLEALRVDDGTWHTVHLLRQRHHMTVSLDKGGDACHWAESRDGIFKEIAIDKESLFIGAMVDAASGMVAGNFVGCLNDARINNVHIGFDGAAEGAVGTPSAGVSENCASDACENVQCSPPFQCRDLWRDYECSCEPGEEYLSYNATSGVCSEIDDCLGDPCFNGATCQDGQGSFTCLCPAEFHGNRCEFTSLCISDPCQNGATCEDVLEDFICSCPPGYYGDLCENYDECYDEPCVNGGTCTDGDNSYKCECPVGYQGENCDRIDACASDPCLNDGTCTNVLNSYRCECSTGFFGDECQYYDFCVSQPCLNDGNCSLTYLFLTPIGYECQCELGFEGDSCEKDNLCLPNPCQNEGLCTVIGEGDGYACDCAWSYKGDSCEDIDHILARITVAVTLFGAVMVIILLVVAICCANRYTKKESLNNNLPMQKGDTEMALIEGKSSTRKAAVAFDDTVMDAGVYKGSNEYENTPVVEEKKGTENVAYVHADESGEVAPLPPPDYDSDIKKPPSENNSTSDEGYSQENGAENGSVGNGENGSQSSHDHDKIEDANH
ncbi:neural-cadherin-like [Glandiceps talaboti]